MLTDWLRILIEGALRDGSLRDESIEDLAYNWEGSAAFNKELVKLTWLCRNCNRNKICNINRKVASWKKNMLQKKWLLMQFIANLCQRQLFTKTIGTDLCPFSCLSSYVQVNVSFSCQKFLPYDFLCEFL